MINIDPNSFGKLTQAMKDLTSKIDNAAPSSNHYYLVSEDMKLKDIIGSNLPNSDFKGRLEAIEDKQQKTSEHINKFISLLTYPDKFEGEIQSLRDEVKSLKVKSVELVKGVVELSENDKGIELDFYTVLATGESGMSQSTLAKLAGVNKSSICRLESTLVTKAPSHYLESYINKGFTLVTSDQAKLTIDGQDTGNLNIYKSDFCAAVITHYAMKGNQVALYYLANFCSLGITKWIHGITGWTSKN